MTDLFAWAESALEALQVQVAGKFNERLGRGEEPEPQFLPELEGHCCKQQGVPGAENSACKKCMAAIPF
jgi:hypothetical protein